VNDEKRQPELPLFALQLESRLRGAAVLALADLVAGHAAHGCAAHRADGTAHCCATYGGTRTGTDHCAFFCAGESVPSRAAPGQQGRKTDCQKSFHNASMSNEDFYAIDVPMRKRLFIEFVTKSRRTRIAA
jgi:hypothetical protein